MKIVKVTYTVQAGFVEENKKNAETFINEVSKLDKSSIRYFSFLGQDGKTFTHLALYDNVEAQNQFLALPAFKEFQQKRDASGLEQAEHLEILELVATSREVF